MDRHEAWLFGAAPWHPSIALRALNPVSFVRWYRTMRARWIWVPLHGGGTAGTRAWPSRRRLLRYMLWCRWQDLTGWKTRMNKGETP